MSNLRNHLVQLDGLRFIAVTLVMLDHWLGEANPFPLGYFGVNLFFVLSGFLITRILIHSQQRDTELGRGHGHSLKVFFIRRNLRIWPVYYLTILVLALVHFQGVRLSFWWLITYTTNFWIVIHQSWLGAIDHLWSLAVEEQYYLFFPFLLLFTPERYLLRMLWSLIGLSVVLRILLFATNAPWMTQFVMMPTCLDAFGLGGILAWLIVYRKETFERLVRSNAFLIGSFVLYIVHLYVMLTVEPNRNLFTDVTDRFITSVFCAAIIGRAVLGFGQPLKAILENRVATYLGQISYGLYLFHNIVFNYYHTQPTFPTLRVWNKVVSMVPFLNSTPLFQLAYFYALTVLLAALSWHLVEKPINSLKGKFSY
ncbi:acyltransferase family protein [Rudanella lutea]|uniref:acyltransferase family protein n=1 Tax=Rudanella lutea TaxID=451374 RepID=UPI000373B0CA|nr:acyltransferase [Rudanella lutea]